MAIARYYKVGVFDTSTPAAVGAAVSTTTTQPILYGTASATADLNISAVRVSCLGASTFPSNASYAAGIQVITGASVAGGNSATATQIGQGTLPANTRFLTAGGTSAGTIGPFTAGKYLWAQDIPFTAGANWAEWFTPGFEINIPAGEQFAITITQSSAQSGCTFAGEIEFTE